MPRKPPWPVIQPADAAALTTRQVLSGSPVLLVTHYVDRSWAFRCGDSDEPIDGRVITMGEAMALDPTLYGIAFLTPGRTARRETIGGEWLVEGELVQRSRV